MNRLIRKLLSAVCLLTGPVALLAQPLKLPLEFRQSDTLYNFQSQRGVPISQTNGVPPGSDGRMTTVNESYNSTVQPTARQFQSVISFGGVPGLAQSDWLAVSNSPVLNGSNAFSSAVAVEMRLPLGTSNNLAGGPVAIILRRGQIGAPYLSRQVSFAFGTVVEVPATDENGVLLTNIVNTAYWLPQPYTTNGHTNSGYYWSPHAGKVYAIQSGPLQVTWVKAAYTNGVPYDYATNSNNYWNNGGNYFRLYTASYVVSGSAVKPPRKFYWTEKAFGGLGKPVSVPTARVGAVIVAYNNFFPQTVPSQYIGPGETNPTDGSTNQVLQELRTLWYDQQQGTIQGYNQEGRVFLELLGDLKPDNQTREQLGIEIVDVVRSPTPLDKTIELGEVIQPPLPDPLKTLTPEPVLQSSGFTYDYQQNVGNSGLLTLYAARETANQNDYLVHWMEVGEASLKWPKLLGRYQLVWPPDAARYSHYVRPLVATEEEAKATAVPLPTANAPTIEYQDPLDQIRGKLTETFAYYSFLDAAHSAHRALLRFSSGDAVAFERVFSWLDLNLKTTNFAGSVATNLTTVANYLNYPAAYANYLASGPRGVNGDWKLFVSDDLGGGVGSISSWALVVETTNSAAGTLLTQEFTSSGGITINDGAAATPYPSTITISGVTDPVTTVRVKLNGLSHQYEADVDAFLVGPRGQVCALISDAGGDVTINNVNLLFDDAAATLVPGFPAVTSGTYRPTDYQIGEPLPPGATGAIGTSLAALLSPAPILPSVPTPWSNEYTAPRVVNADVLVGQRINAPAEPGAPTGYLAGHINLDAGTLFDINAYVDPFARGFDEANLSAIIPVNAIPDKNHLEVWWFRTNAPSAGANAANRAQGFLPLFWPSVIGRYTIQWPLQSDEIVLASNDGSGALLSLEASGTVYFQNNRALPGFNPNEEHALMQGGQAYALRDDLNIINGTNYSSEPFVLLDYTDSDNRPNMSVFRVLREKGPDTFNYQVEAGAILQPPMPLPLLDLPLGPKPAGAQPRSLNQEIYFRSVATSTTAGELTTTEPHHFQPWYRELALQSPDLSTNKWFFATNADYANRTLQGVVSDTNSFELSNGSTSSNTPSIFRYDVVGPIPGVGRTVYVMAPELGASWRMAMLSNASSTVYLNLTQGDGDPVQGSRLFVPATNSLSTDQFAGWHLRTEPIPASHNTNHGSFTFQDRKGNIWVYRGPHQPGDDPWMDMQYYYKTLPGFFFPTLPLAQQPPPGTITPYLRNTNSAGTFVGDPVYGNPANSSVAGANNALAIHYRPVWPAFAPVLQMAETLTMPKRGLPAVRGQTSLEVFYQQSQVTNMDRVTVRLHDPTREKEFELAAPDSTSVLGRIPDSVKTETSLGRTYFPFLPPHLGQRFFLDPNRGQHGKLVFRGEFVDEIVGDKYLNLNVLSVKDATTLSNLCLISDPARGRWNNAIASLTTRMERFVESPQQPGTYVPAEGAVTNGPNELAEVTDDDVAVDSYALTAVGRGAVM